MMISGVGGLRSETGTEYAREWPALYLLFWREAASDFEHSGAVAGALTATRKKLIGCIKALAQQPWLEQCATVQNPMLLEESGALYGLRDTHQHCSFSSGCRIHNVIHSSFISRAWLYLATRHWGYPLVYFRTTCSITPQQRMYEFQRP